MRSSMYFEKPNIGLNGIDIPDVNSYFGSFEVILYFYDILMPESAAYTSFLRTVTTMISTSCSKCNFETYIRRNL